MSSFIRNAAIDKIEDEFLDEERIMKAREAASAGKIYSHDEAWTMIGGK